MAVGPTVGLTTMNGRDPTDATDASVCSKFHTFIQQKKKKKINNTFGFKLIMFSLLAIQDYNRSFAFNYA